MSANRREDLRTLLTVHADPADLLRKICDLCVPWLAVSGARIRVLGTVAVVGGCALQHSSDDLGVRLDELATTAGSGPHLDALELGRPVFVPDLNEATTRWPGFTAGAVAAGASALFSFPLQVGGARLGVLELYHRVAGSLTPNQLSEAFMLVDIATEAIVDGAHGVPPLALPELVDIQPEVHQATGMLAVDLRVGLTEALSRIRGHAFAHYLTLAQVAREILDHRLRLDRGL